MVTQRRPQDEQTTARQPVRAEDAAEMALEAYQYAFPLVLMDATREAALQQGAITNRFQHLAKFPDASFKDVVRPNADTLYSLLWYDVRKEPLVISLPESKGRYYLLEMIDMWTDVFASPGSRTTGTDAQTLAIVAGNWSGQLPPGIDVIRAPTPTGWIVGRTQTSGASGYEAAHAFQAGIVPVPLSSLGKASAAQKAGAKLTSSDNPPLQRVMAMDGETFFARFVSLLSDNPPHANDYPVLARLRRFGIEPGRSPHASQDTAAVRAAIAWAPKAFADNMKGAFAKIGTAVNGWRLTGSPIGTYGTDYIRRAVVAYVGLGANTLEDAIYPSALADAEGRPFDSAGTYIVHFPKGDIPPVRAFWSLTMYNDAQLFARNPIDRYVLRDRDDLHYNPDGSLDLYLQRQSPGPERLSNWLPTPASGGFSLNLRLYWPKREALDGTWQPPPVRRQD